MTPASFRCLILASLVLLAASAFVDPLFPGLIPPSVSQAVEEAPLPSMVGGWWFPVLVVPWALALLVATIGLLFFRRWARALSLWATLVGFAFYPFLGAQVSSGWASGFGEASATLWGAALATAFFSPLRERFAVQQ